MQEKSKSPRYPPLSLSILAATPDKLFSPPTLVAQAAVKKQYSSKGEINYHFSSLNNHKNDIKRESKSLMSSPKPVITKGKALTLDQVAMYKDKSSFKKYFAALSNIKEAKSHSESLVQKTLLGLTQEESENNDKKKKKKIPLTKEYLELHNKVNSHRLFSAASNYSKKRGRPDEIQKPVITHVETDLFKSDFPHVPFNPKGDYMNDAYELINTNDAAIRNKLEIVRIKTVELPTANEEDDILDQNLEQLKNFKSSIVKLHRWNLRNKSNNDKTKAKNDTSNGRKSIYYNKSLIESINNDDEDEEQRIADLFHSQVSKKKVILRKQKVEERAQKQTLKDELPKQIGLSSWDATARLIQTTSARTEQHNNFFMTSADEVSVASPIEHVKLDSGLMKTLATSHWESNLNLRANTSNNKHMTYFSVANNNQDLENNSQMTQHIEEINSNGELTRKSMYNPIVFSSTRRNISSSQRKILKISAKSSASPVAKNLENSKKLRLSGRKEFSWMAKSMSQRELEHNVMQDRYKLLTEECHNNAQSSGGIHKMMNMNFKTLRSNLDKLGDEVVNTDFGIDKQIKKDILAHMNSFIPSNRKPSIRKY